MTVTDDTSTFEDNALVEVTFNGDSAWTRKSTLLCCYLKSDKEWVLCHPDRPAELSAAREKIREAEMKEATPEKKTGECDRAVQHLNDLRGAGMYNTSQYRKEAEFVKECKGH